MRFEYHVALITSARIVSRREAGTGGEAALDNGSCPGYTPKMETEYMFHIREQETARV
jgi:hypothetical protein